MFVLSANVIEKIINLIDGVENERELLIRLAVAVGLIAAVAVFRNKIASAFAALFSKFFSKSSEKVRRSVKESLSRPLAFFAVILSLYAASEILAPTGQVRGWFLTLLKIGFIVFVPFIVLDLVVANILLALGMFMLSPTIISLPFKLLIFIAVDGWALIVQGLVQSYN